MKLSHTQLEEATRDPRAWMDRNGERRIFRFGYFQALVLTAQRWHLDYDEDSALNYLNQRYEKNFISNTRLPGLQVAFRQYCLGYLESGSQFVRKKLRMALELGSGVQLTGEIARLDIVPGGGYRAWLFAEREFDWRRQDRMPLIQAWVADYMNAPGADVDVGFYFFESGSYQRASYSDAEIAAARGRASQLAANLAALV